jgi:alkylation response protein AidB-like acyl-CoA dehydrogenase
VAECAGGEEVGVNFTFSAEQEMLRDTVRSFLADRSPMSRVREVMETESGFDAAVWAAMAELGLLGMHLPEEDGGAGSTFLELGIMMEELGRALTPVPFLSCGGVGAGALRLAGTPEQQHRYLPDVVAGEHRLAVAIAEPDGDWGIDAITCQAQRSGSGETRLSGSKSFVLDGHTATTLVVAARDDDGGVGLHLVPAAADGVAATRLETMDMTRKLARIDLTDVVVPEENRLAGATGDTIARLYDLAVVALAFEQVGGAERCMETSVEYAKVRYQFGRPIGSFQAIKHKCADMLVQVESAKSAAYYAGWAATADPAELLIAAPLAKAYCSDAYFDVAAETIQVHGGIGFTWEHDAHLYFKRAKSSQLMFGSPAEWRARLADRLGL